MFIYHKVLFILTIFIISGCAWSSNNNSQVSDIAKKQCISVSYGKVHIDKLKTSHIMDNSYLLECAMAVAIGDLGETLADRKTRTTKKLKLADYLMPQGIDIKYKSKDNTTLLMSAILSYFPKIWKIKFVEMSLVKGVDINIRNAHRSSALDYAEFKKESEIIKILKSHHQQIDQQP